MKNNAQSTRMQGLIHILFSVITTVLLCGMAIESGFAVTARDVVRRVQDRYNKVNDIQANLEQVFYWKITNARDSNSGKIYLKKKDYFRLEVKGQILVTDGKQVWTHSPTNNQTIIERFRGHEETFLPQSFIFSFSRDYRPELSGEERVNERDCYKLVLRPIKEHDVVKLARIWVDKKEWITYRIEYTDVNDNLTTYNLSDIQFNAKLKKDLFKFESPPGTEVIDMR